MNGKVDKNKLLSDYIKNDWNKKKDKKNYFRNLKIKK
jgi:hypothetical protein